jgi:hypothetical protein
LEPIQVNLDLSGRVGSRQLKKLGAVGFISNHGNKPILNAVAGKDIGEGRCDNGAKTILAKRPDGVFSRRAASKVTARYKNGGSEEASIVENALRILTPIIKKEVAKTGSLNTIEKLLGDYLIGVDIIQPERHEAAPNVIDWLHVRSPP